MYWPGIVVVGTNSNFVILISLQTDGGIKSLISIFNDIGLKRYRDCKIRVCGKDSIPLIKFKNRF